MHCYVGRTEEFDKFSNLVAKVFYCNAKKQVIKQL